MNLILRLFAGIIDFLQFIFFIVLVAFQFITPVGAGVAGGLSGAVLCWNLSTGFWESLTNAAVCLAGGGAGAALLSFVAAPAGVAIDMAISCTFGVLLIAVLWASGRFSLMAVLIGFTGELLPGINAFVPAWSLLVHRCIHQYNTAKKEGISTTRTSKGILITAAKLVPALGGGTAAALVRAAPKVAATQSRVQSYVAERVPLQMKSFDGIRRPTGGQEPYATTA